jgi:SAM-dependent methyltransferase
MDCGGVGGEMAASDYERGIGDYYGGLDFEAALLDALRAAGKDPDALSVEDIGSLDQLHVGGRDATLALAQEADIRASDHVLDVGSGLGGPARTLAASFSCQVTGLDLSPEFCRVAQRFTERVGLADRVRFQHGSATDMPFGDRSFDVVWMHNVGMNIPDKESLYREIYRVLRPGGRLVFSEYMAGPEQPLIFPVPWAREASLSFLHAAEKIRELLRAAGFNERTWNDRTAQALATPPTPAPQGTNLGNVFSRRWGPDTPVVGQNLMRNLQERRMVEIEALLERPS